MAVERACMYGRTHILYIQQLTYAQQSRTSTLHSSLKTEVDCTVNPLFLLSIWECFTTGKHPKNSFSVRDWLEGGPSSLRAWSPVFSARAAALLLQKTTLSPALKSLFWHSYYKLHKRAEFLSNMSYGNFTKRWLYIQMSSPRWHNLSVLTLCPQIHNSSVGV